MPDQVPDAPQTPPTPDFLSSGTILPADAGGPARRRTPWWLLAVAAAAVAALVGGVTYGVSALSGGGRQAADALPAGAGLFVSVDLDPPAGQKVDALRFLRQFPSVRGKVAGDGDLRRSVFEAVAGPAGWGDLRFESDVAPWLGQRVGAAAYPLAKDATGTPDVVVALQVTDEGAARTGLDKLIAASPGSHPGYVLADGYALLAQSQAAATRAASRAADAPLSGDAQFTSDVAGLGDAVATVWTDSSRIARMVPAGATGGVGGVLGGPLAGVTGAQAKGRAAFVLRFGGPDVLELAGRTVGADLGAATASTVSNLGDLPASTVAAVGLAGGQDAAAAVWRQLTASSGSSAEDLAAQAKDQLGLDLPADLATLLGSRLELALDGTDLGSGTPAVGARVTTSDPAQADDLVGTLVGRTPLPGDLRIVHRQTVDGYVVASTAAQAARLSAAPGQKLGDAEAFRQALPDLSSARFAVWVDVASALKAANSGSDGQVSVPALKPVTGLGLTVSTAEAGTATFRLRVVTG